MDLNTITEIGRPRARGDLAPWRDGDAWLAGGTWLFSEPQPGLTRLIDLAGLGWPPLETGPAGLRIAATCTLSRLAAAEFPPEWRAGPLFGACCEALLGSFKIRNAATVGGNLCMALPAGPMAALCVALDGVGVAWTPDGGERRIPMREFIHGPQRNALAPGELLRAVALPAAALRRRTALRKMSLTPLGRSAALLAGTLAADGAFGLTVTAATRRPVRLDFPAIPGEAALRAALAAAIPAALWYDDLHGAPAWREHLTHRLALEIREELAA
ncbi:FAD binding domain-containing protein [Roseomonas sp. NAR14]|uniref:FAD binding domain-containing protein n=1 Tax=Roseomonas acroporae TaxID=2937791 RepID=A0A9X1YAF6_9PROT|nr:FAD binding domain-containing protein [Roseomonas acroporae]MCK8787129.1 FAD binding domain-containing protein [Roseomonas acroporae]